MSSCLSCYGALGEGDQDYHASCSRAMFGSEQPPELPYSEDDIATLAADVLRSQTVVTGVQPKLSLHLTSAGSSAITKRFTIVGLWGGFILKPPTERYPGLPEVEHLTMRLAEMAGIATVPHCLLRLRSGSLAYLTKRVDRKGRGKLAMEDMCQLTNRLTEHKYRGSYEQIAGTIQKYSATPGLDVVNFFEVVLFCYLTGNADMHLKNFSLLEKPGLGMVLSPAYDLVNTTIVNPSDTEQLALTLRGKKKNLTQRDFTEAMSSVGLDQRQQENIFAKLKGAVPSWHTAIDQSFLSDRMKSEYKQLIVNRAERFAQV